MTVEVPEQDTNIDTPETMAAMSDEDFLKFFEEQSRAEVSNTVETEDTEPVLTDTPTDTSPPPDSEVQGQSKEVQDSNIPENTSEQQVNYEDFYKTLTTPFKANGRDFQVTDPQDMITLMQKGADYVKKMTEIKPLRRMGKLLEDNQISEDDIAFLLDLKAKKPEAIAKLVKESEVDIYGLDSIQTDSYTPQPIVVNEVDSMLQNTLDDLQATSATFTQTLHVVGNQWDDSSRQVISQNPELLRILDRQVADGTFNKIDNVLQYERAMGRLTGVSDIQAYVEIERRMGIGHQAMQPQPTPSPTQQAQSQAVAQQQQQQEQKRKQAAAAPRQTHAQTSQPSINVAAMSDDEFMKFMAAQGL